MLGQVVYRVRGRQQTATLTDQGRWECDDAGIADLLNASYPVQITPDLDTVTGRFALYRAGERLGGQVQVTQTGR
jgi:hypothetical protein